MTPYEQSRCEEWPFEADCNHRMPISFRFCLRINPRDDVIRRRLSANIVFDRDFIDGICVVTGVGEVGLPRHREYDSWDRFERFVTGSVPPHSFWGIRSDSEDSFPSFGSDASVASFDSDSSFTSSSSANEALEEERQDIRAILEQLRNDEENGVSASRLPSLPSPSQIHPRDIWLPRDYPRSEIVRDFPRRRYGGGEDSQLTSTRGVGLSQTVRTPHPSRFPQADAPNPLVRANGASKIGANNSNNITRDQERDRFPN